jgi:ABC-type Zn2+ transport system substrate-binding protein/surface adhesin
LLTLATKREEKEDDNEHEDRDQEAHEQLQAQVMQIDDDQDQNHNDQDDHYWLQPRRRTWKVTINMRTTTRKDVSSCKHKRCKMTTAKIKITMTRTIVSNCSQEGGKGK